MTLTRQNILDWIDALESGEYEQGQGILRTHNDKYCCLGVLAEILKIPKERVLAYYIYKFDNLKGEIHGGLPGFSSNTGLPTHILSARDQSTLMHMNDTDNVSFKEIAEWIRANILPEYK